LASTKNSKETSASDEPLVINGWQIFAHPLLLEQLEKLIRTVETAKEKSPESYKGLASTKVLAALFRLMFNTIPDDPTRSEYRQGSTLGVGKKHWFRAKFGGQRFRLFFRYSSSSKVIIYAWVNDAETLRTYASKTDAYVVFASMLESGNPPDSFDDLLVAARTGAAPLRRLRNDAAPER
jgi:toxin YhaV